jgi:hypothetical protein
VSIAPKLHQRTTSTTKPHPLDVSSTSKVEGGKTTSQTFPPRILRVLPPRLAPGLEQQDVEVKYKEILAYVSARTFAHLANTDWPIPMNEVVKENGSPSPDVSATTGYTHSKDFLKAYLRRLPPPSDPTKPPPRPTAAQVLQSPDTLGREDGKNEKGAQKDLEIWIAYNSAVYIPGRHLLVPDGLKDLLGDWDLVR